jgi:aspartyl-tRNA(Asn)/glutamyl-tRNA(Gln) amidotransferase subunit A
VAAGEIPIALGSDTGGSIRQPCAFCSVTGIKPTYGSVSRYGLLAYASSLDQIGPIGQNIDDCAALLSIISGPDTRDSTCVIKKPFEFEKAPTTLEGVKIGLPRNYFGGGIDEEVKNAVLAAAAEFHAAGAIIEEFEMPLIDYMVPAYYIIACAEASSNLSRYDGLKYGYRSANANSLSEVYRLSRNEGFGLEVKRRIMLGSFVLSSGYYDAYYKKALQVRSLIKDAYNNLFTKYDMILSPVAPTTAYRIGENVGDPVKMYMGDIYTISINLAGLPAASLPCGFDAAGLPIGFQLIGDAFTENKIIGAARAYHARTDYHVKRPGSTKV